MTRVFWMTADCFLDVDLPIVTALQDDLEIDWHIEFSRQRSNTYGLDSVREAFHSKNVQITSHRHRYRNRDPRNILHYFYLCMRLRRGKYDAIYVDDYGFPYFFFLLYLLVGTKRVIYAAHDVKVHVGFNGGRWIQWYLNFIFRRFNRFHFFSQTQREIFEKAFGRKESFVAPLCIKDYGETKCEPSNEVINFLFFGLIRENKGLKYLIQAADALAEKYAGRFKVTIAGGCNEWDELYAPMIKNRDAFDLKIGIVPNDEIPDLFGCAHYVVLPYLDVTQCGPLMVAYNYARPVIASDLPGFREFVGNGGFLFKCCSILSLTEKMEGCIDGGYGAFDCLRRDVEFMRPNYQRNNVCGKYFEFFGEVC